MLIAATLERSFRATALAVITLCACESKEGASERTDHLLVPSARGPAPEGAPTTSASVAKPKPPPRQGDDFRGTVGVVEQRRAVETSILRSLRSGKHERYDRIVFELDAAVPGYSVRYVDDPVRRCGSGDTTEVAGRAWLEIKLEPAHAHTELGKPTITDREQKLELGVARELELTCDFEAQVVWVLGVTAVKPFRVLELTDPARLVVDVHH